MHYVDEGRGEPVIMLHGNPTWSFYFRELIQGLSGRYRAVAPDHIGCGLSDTPRPGAYAYRLKNRVDDLEALLAHLGLTGHHPGAARLGRDDRCGIRPQRRPPHRPAGSS
jgi:haloalkane dehalogenase